MPDLTQHQTAVEAVLAYMLDHNEHHAEELLVLSHDLPEDAAALPTLREAVELYRAANQRLAQALAQLK